MYCVFCIWLWHVFVSRKAEMYREPGVCTTITLPERARADPHMLNSGLLKTMPRAAAEGGVIRVAMDPLHATYA